MRQRVILDTGPLVAAVNRRDTYHTWTLQQLKEIQKPLITCEAVLSEASFLLRSVYGGRQALLSWMVRGLVEVDFRLSVELTAIQELMQRYDSVPISLADACLIRMAEINAGSTVFTIDSDFLIYRMNRTQMIPVLMPKPS